MQNKHQKFFLLWVSQPPVRGGGGQVGWNKIPSLSKEIFLGLPLLCTSNHKCICGSVEIRVFTAAPTHATNHTRHRCLREHSVSHRLPLRLPTPTNQAKSAKKCIQAWTTFLASFHFLLEWRKPSERDWDEGGGVSAWLVSKLWSSQVRKYF